MRKNRGNFLKLIFFVVKKIAGVLTPAQFLKPSEWIKVKQKLNHKLNTCQDEPNYNDLLQLFNILDRRMKTKDFRIALETEKNYILSDSDDQYTRQRLLFRVNMSGRMFRFCSKLLREST